MISGTSLRMTGATLLLFTAEKKIIKTRQLNLKALFSAGVAKKIHLKVQHLFHGSNHED